MQTDKNLGLEDFTAAINSELNAGKAKLLVDAILSKNKNEIHSLSVPGSTGGINTNQLFHKLI